MNPEGPEWMNDWKVGVRLWLERSGEAILGPGRLELLEAIDRCHSISATAPRPSHVLSSGLAVGGQHQPCGRGSAGAAANGRSRRRRRGVDGASARRHRCLSGHGKPCFANRRFSSGCAVLDRYRHCPCRRCRQPGKRPALSARRLRRPSARRFGADHLRRLRRTGRSDSEWRSRRSLPQCRRETTRSPGDGRHSRSSQPCFLGTNRLAAIAFTAGIAKLAPTCAVCCRRR